MKLDVAGRVRYTWHGVGRGCRVEGRRGKEEEEEEEERDVGTAKQKEKFAGQG